ncbi:MAG: hypothetical protein WDO69_15115 [Pseudomonadota bacterium]
MTNRNLRYSGLGLAVFTAGAIAACSSSDPGTPSAAAGSGSGGAHAGGAGGAPSTAGANTTAGSAGTGTAGTGTAGAGTGGTGPGFSCANTKPTDAVITDFSNLVANPTTAGQYTFMGGVLGGTFTYQANALTLDPTGMVLNVKGNVKDYDGFGVYFNTCYDASAYTGVSFNIKGAVGSKGTLNFRVQTNTNTAIDAANSKGSCVPTDPTNTYPDCHPSSFDIPVSAGGSVVTVMFSQLTGGMPIAAVTGNNVVGLEWAFNWDPAAGTAGSGAGGASGGSGGASAGSGGKGGAGGASGGSGGATTGTGGASGGTVGGSYDANVTIDDIKFVGGPPAGGAGGASSGGSSAGGTTSAGSGGSSAGTGGKAGSGG